MSERTEVAARPERGFLDSIGYPEAVILRLRDEDENLVAQHVCAYGCTADWMVFLDDMEKQGLLPRIFMIEFGAAFAGIAFVRWCKEHGIQMQFYRGENRRKSNTLKAD